MKSISFALAVTAISVVPANALPIGLLLPFHKNLEMVVGIVSRCTTTASYTLVIRNALDNKVLHREDGLLAAGRGVALPYSFGATQTGSFMGATVHWTCPDTVRRPPLVSATVRDLNNKVPEFIVLPETGS